MSQAPIFNASSRLLNQLSGTLPDVSGAMLDYFQEMVFTTVVKSIVNFQVVEVGTSITFQGLWQPFQSKDLQIKPEGQRTWQYSRVYAQINLALPPDSVITYLGTQYRVISTSDFSQHGFYEYFLVQDYSGLGPS